jgi:hypothetical protein
MKTLENTKLVTMGLLLAISASLLTFGFINSMQTANAQPSQHAVSKICKVHKDGTIHNKHCKINDNGGPEIPCRRCHEFHHGFGPP